MYAIVEPGPDAIGALGGAVVCDALLQPSALHASAHRSSVMWWCCGRTARLHRRVYTNGSYVTISL